jgi:hypothetical protein
MAVHQRDEGIWIPKVNGLRDQETADDLVSALTEAPGCIFFNSGPPGCIDNSLPRINDTLLMLAPHFPSIALVVSDPPFTALWVHKLTAHVPAIFVAGEGKQPPEEDTDLVVLGFMNRDDARRYTEDLRIPWVWVVPPFPTDQFESWRVSLPPGQRAKAVRKTG